MRPNKNPHVYEYRSGVLVPGKLQEYSAFIPEVGGKIIDFKDYKYTPDGPQIYNLPGFFMKKSDYDKMMERGIDPRDP